MGANAKPIDAALSSVEIEPEPPALDPKEQRRLHREREAADIQRLHEIFVAEQLEDANGVLMFTHEPWRMWKALCGARRQQPGSQRAFRQRLAKNFTHDPNNGRPREWRAKHAGPTLRVVNTA